MLKEMLKKTPKRIVKNESSKSNVPDGMFMRCPKCKEIIYSEDLVANKYVCPKCEHYFRINAKQRIEMVLDRGLSITPRAAGIPSMEPVPVTMASFILVFSLSAASFSSYPSNPSGFSPTRSLSDS